MPFSDDESDLHFDFDDDWHVIKYEDHPACKHLQQALSGSKTVDYLASRGQDLYLIEVKNFTGYAIENRARVTSGDLISEVGYKVRDTIAGLVGAGRNPAYQDDLRQYLRLLCKADAGVKVVLWIEHRLPAYPPQRQKARQSVSGNALKQRLRWLTTHVLVCSVEDNGLPGLAVRRLPRF